MAPTSLRISKSYFIRGFPNTFYGIVMKEVPLGRVNCYNMKKQHLLDSCKGDSVLEVLDDVSALHATNPQTPYLSLLARLRFFRKEMFDQLM